jgi:hypothetical protein
MLVNYEKFMRPDLPEHIFLVTCHEKFLSRVRDMLFTLYVYRTLKQNTAQFSDSDFW